ncbi:MAG TPA: 50S ribosomal protein L13 [Bacilli bacterium]|jgi:large subunit ribosomal protein L13|nr:50S ribosomal protein L13 [Acholeplasmataceae bacterium]HNZ77213.1 50S ribosomal protein L13 [Bacilli bacterium]HOD61246.1 50S ribosomal protein L13 [Bacilli bacterium]HOH61500.1 50S ribosomal protein L13 [Bacilli bacterium]HPB49433.1 50S ribosomal protein L13 [Bacilli bacterium]
MSKTYMANKQTVEKKWFVIDAENLVLGRLSTEVATLLRGKHKPIFTPHVDCGDYVIIVNAEKVALTGNKLADKMYYRHSGYPGGLKSRNAERMLELQPQKVLEESIRGMLPKTKLGDDMYRKLYVYVGPEHPHQAQKPEVYHLKG